MKKGYIYILCGLLTWVVFQGCGGDASAGDTADAGSEGKELFRTYCVACHGVKGNLQMNGAKVLGESELSLEERILVIKNGRNVMTPFGKVLTPEQIEAVAQYTFSFGRPEEEGKE